MCNDDGDGTKTETKGIRLFRQPASRLGGFRVSLCPGNTGGSPQIQQSGSTHSTQPSPRRLRSPALAGGCLRRANRIVGVWPTVSFQAPNGTVVQVSAHCDQGGLRAI